MAGYSKAFFIGELGGFQGADGINPIHFIILVGDADRQWLEAHYIDTAIKPLGAIKRIIPERPDSEITLIDACIAFYPSFFRECSALRKVESQLGSTELLDFDQGKQAVPAAWKALRAQAGKLIASLHVFQADLKPMDLSGIKG